MAVVADVVKTVKEKVSRSLLTVVVLTQRMNIVSLRKLNLSI